MVKPRAREAGEGVDDAAYTGCIVQHDKGVNRVMIHRLACFNYLRLFADSFGGRGHNSRNLSAKEFLSQTLHSTAYIPISYDTNQTLFPLP